VPTELEANRPEYERIEMNNLDGGKNKFGLDSKWNVYKAHKFKNGARLKSCHFSS